MKIQLWNYLTNRYLRGENFLILLNECVAVGIYLSWHVTYNGNLSSEAILKNFLESEWLIDV